MRISLRPLLRDLPLTDRVTYWHELLSASLGGVFQGLGLSLISIVARRIGMDATEIAIMVSMPYAGYLMSLVLGHQVQGRPPMPWVFWPGVISRGLLLSVALVRSRTAFMVIMCVYYVVATFSGPAYAAIMKSNYSEANRGKLMSRIRILQTAIVAGSSYLAGTILQAYPLAYRWVVPVGGAFGMASSLVFRHLKVRRTADRSVPPAGVRESLRTIASDRTFVILMIIFFINAGAGKMAIPLEPLRLVDELGMDYRQAGFITGTVTAVASMVGYWMWGRLSARRHPMRLLLLVFALGMARNPIVALARNPWHIVPASIVAGFSNAGYDLVPLFAIMRLAGPGRLPFYVAFHNSLVGVRGLIGPYLGTALHTGSGISISGVYWIITGIGAVGVLAMLVFLLQRAARGKPLDPRASPPG